MMAKPHPTGIMIPQIPTPLTSRKLIENSRTITMMNEMVNPNIHPLGVRRVRTMWLIFSVTEAVVYPGPTTGGRLMSTSARCSGFSSIGLSPSGRVVDIAECYCVGGAGGLAGRGDITIAYFSAFSLGVDFCAADPLDAVAAFLHYAPASDGHLRVPHQFKARGLPIREQQEIEPPHFVWAIVRAIASTHAPVVDHCVDSLGAMGSRRNRANDFAGSILAVHAQDRLEKGAWIGGFSNMVAIDANPMHLAPIHYLLLAYNRDVVFGLASNHTSIATHTCIQVDRHPPLVAVRIVIAHIQRRRIERILELALGETGVLLVLLERGMPDDMAPLHRVLKLRACKRVLVLQLCDLEARR